MKIAIIGAGNVGGALGRALGRKGHEIFYGSQKPGEPKTQALREATGPSARAGTPAEAAAFGEVIFFATPWHATEASIRSAGDLTGKIVVDCTNPLKADLSGLEIGLTSSGAELVAGWATGAKVCKAFNSTGFNIMEDPTVGGIRTVMFVCGDDPSAKTVVLQLAEDVGFDAVDAGPLTQARLLEPWAMLWVYLAYKGGLGRDFAFALLKRDGV